ncbi:helix-turn-helix domain-containing protein, partial [Bacteroidales bacterium OttesenSCG-928-M11]|nr:helix-turn-helix domain-containing protein [Bacteroidales bacterium OttesenSCG-928-M11]
YLDWDENLWLGSFRKGLIFIPSKLNNFENYRYKYLNKESKNSGMLTALFKNEHHIYIGTNNDGIYAISQQSDKTIHYERSTKQLGIPANILLIKEAPKGKFFLGSYTDGLSLFDPITGRCKYYTSTPAGTPSLNKISSIAEDDKGNLWIGTYGNGLYQFDITKEKIVRHFSSTESGDENSLASNTITALVFEGKHLWIGTNRGLSRMEMNENSFISYFASNIGLPSNTILALREDRSGFLWIGTDHGLACLYKLTQEIDCFTTEDGLANNVISAIEQDNKGNLWISTISGISMLSKSDQIFYNFYNSDGLQGLEFSRGAGFKSFDDEIFFVGTNGITSFYPENIQLSKRELNVFINQVYLYNNPIQFGEKSGRNTILSAPLNEYPDITLQETDNVFSIELTTLQYNNPEEIIYYYKLEGFDNDWMNTPIGNNRITYTNLSPGTYRFLFYADNHGIQSPEKTITIRVIPIWYNTFWIRILAALLIIGLSYIFFSFIRSRKQKKKPQTQEIQEESLPISTQEDIIKPEVEIPEETIAPKPPKTVKAKEKVAVLKQKKKEKIKKTDNDILLEKINTIINNNIQNSEFSVEQLATEIGMSRVHLYRKVKEITGKSISDYIREIRLAKAVKLLKQSQLSISEIAEATGFSSLYHFSGCFKEHFGVSPKKYNSEKG